MYPRRKQVFVFMTKEFDCAFANGKTIILPVDLYGCETWSLTLREEHRLRVFENRVLRIFGPKRDEVIGENCIMKSFITCNPRQT
jgi:hypothetical protein